MNALFQDIAFAWRNALKMPATALLIILILSLGIGANSAIFNVVYHTLLAPLPYGQGEKLVLLEQTAPEGLEGSLNSRWSGPTLSDVRDQNEVFSSLAEYNQLPLPLSGQGSPYHAHVGVISWNYFEMLGIEPVHGRLFRAGDDEAGAEPVMLLSHDLWEEKFGSDPNVIGTTLEMKDIAYTVIGVLPELPPYPHDNGIWIPSRSDPYRLFSMTDVESNRETGWISHVFGRVKEGVSLDEAGRGVNTIARRLEAAYPDAYPEDYSIVLTRVKEEIVGNSDMTFLLLQGLAFLIVLIACANVANLNLAGLAARNQELAVREAVGANPGRLARQLLTESILFSLCGAILGLGAAYAGLGLLSKLAAEYTPLATEVEMDVSILWFAFAAALLTGILSGSVSAFSRRDINRALKEGGDKATASASGMKKRKMLLTLQYVVSFVMLTVSTLVVSSLLRLNSQDLGYDTGQMFAVSLNLDVDFSQGWQFQQRQVSDFGSRLLQEVRGVPGVEAAVLHAGDPLMQDLPYYGPGPIEIEGYAFANPDARPVAEFHAASEGYFNAMNIPLLAGRGFEQSDGKDSAHVAIVNERLADRYFPDGSAIGRSIKFSGTEWRTIVGVTETLRSAALDREEGLVIYYNFWQYPTEAVNLYIRSSLEAGELTSVISDIIYSINPNQAIQSIGSMESLKDEWLAPTTVRSQAVFLFGILALLVTLAGVFGFVSYNVYRRIREIGIHMAMGANPGDIVSLVIKRGVATYVLGLIIGLLIVVVSAPLFEPFLYETEAVNPLVFLFSTMVLTIVVLAAMYLPARKASRMSPARALHEE